MVSTLRFGGPALPIQEGGNTGPLYTGHLLLYLRLFPCHLDLNNLYDCKMLKDFYNEIYLHRYLLFRFIYFLMFRVKAQIRKTLR